MIDFEDPDIISFLNRIPDLKLEFIMGELHDSGTDSDDMIVNSSGTFKRRYERDVKRIELKEYKSGRKKYIDIEVNRGGIYDSLPQGLFHQPKKRSGESSITRSIEENKHQKKIEQDARLFFLPYEQELYRLLLLLESEERKSIFNSSQVLNNHILLDFWNIPDVFNSRQVTCLLYILPFAGMIAGNRVLTKVCFENILNDRVEISDGDAIEHELMESAELILGETQLGEDSTIGNKFLEYSTSIILSVFPSVKTSLPEYLEGGSRYTMLQFLCGYFMPYESDISIQIVSNDAFSLSDEFHLARLGVSTNL